MRRNLLKLAVVIAAMIAGASGAWADSTVPALSAGTSLASATIYLANAGANDNKLGLVTSVFDIATGALTIKAGGLTNAMLANSATTVNSVSCVLGSTCTVTVSIGSGVTGLGTGVATALAAAMNGATGPIGGLTPTNNNCIVGNGSAWTSTTCPGGSGGTPAFSAITGSTNTGQALVVGAGSTLTASGGGTIVATSAPANALTGNLSVNSFNSGTSASSSTYWRGDGTWTAAGATGANPTATAGSAAVNGSAGTFMRSDGAPAIALGSSSTFGLVKVDNSTITASGGVISAIGSSGSTPVVFVGNFAGGGGSPNAYTMASTTPTGFTLTDQYQVCGQINVDNTGDSTLNIAGTGGAHVKVQNASGLALLTAGRLQAAHEYCFQYQVSTGAWVLTTQLDGQIVSGATSQTISAAQWVNGVEFDVTASSQTFTLPNSATTLLSGNGVVAFKTISAAATLQASGSDTITYNGTTSGAGGSMSIPVGALVAVSGTGASPTAFSVAPAAGSSAGANPTGTAGPAAVNGVASTFMRSDGAPAVQKGTNAQFGIVEGDGSTITCVAGVCTSIGGSATSIVVGTTTVGSGSPPCFIVNSASTTMACDAAGTGVITAMGNAVNATNGLATYVLASSSAFGLAKADNTTITASGGTISAPLQAAVLPTPGSGATLVGPRSYYVCTTTCTVTLPVPVAGYEFCIMNDDNVSTVITLAALTSSARYENTTRTAYGTAGTGTFASGGATGDKVCVVGRDSTHYLTVSFSGVWTPT